MSFRHLLKSSYSSIPCVSLTCRIKLEFFLYIKSQYSHLNSDCCRGDPDFLLILNYHCTISNKTFLRNDHSNSFCMVILIPPLLWYQLLYLSRLLSCQDQHLVYFLFYSVWEFFEKSTTSILDLIMSFLCFSFWVLFYVGFRKSWPYVFS